MHDVVRLAVGSTNLIEVCRLHSIISPETLITSAVLTADVFNASNVIVSNSGSPITLTAVTNVDGSYRGRILSTAAYAVGDRGYIRISVAPINGAIRVFYMDYVVIQG